jgi:hypothetical protein
MNIKDNQDERDRLIQAYFDKFGGMPPTDVIPDPETEEYWTRVQTAIETGEKFQRDDIPPGIVL